jgi:NADH-quinone oxidoreductase subunit G
MADLVKVSIDGIEIEVEPETLIIEAARRVGVDIPTFCYDERLKSVGACRMCLVEVEKSPKLIASCATPVGPGMVVKTNTEKVVTARKGVLEFLLINHPLDCPTCDKGGECPLQNHTYKYGPPTSRYIENKIRFQEGTDLKFDDIRIGPEIWLNRNRCIICYKCVRIARDLAGSVDIGVFNRGAYAQIDIPTEIQYANEFSGNTVEYCPVGALMSDSFRYKVRTWLMSRRPSVCWLCPDGCNITVEQRLSAIYRHSSRRNDNVDTGFLCDKGRYAFDLATGKERIRMPQAIANGLFRDIGYDEALAVAVHRLSEQKGETMALLLDTTLTNEDAFCAAEYFRTNFAGSTITVSTSHNIDPGISPLNLGLSVSMNELETAGLVIMAGCDLAVEHPIIGLRIKKLANRGVPVYFIGSRAKRLGRFKVANIITRSGDEADILKDIASFTQNADGTRLPSSIEENLKRDLQNAKNIHILAGADFLDSPIRGKYAAALYELGNRFSARNSILVDESNYLGVCLAAQPVATFEKLIEKIEQGKIKTLFVAGGNPINIYPDRRRIIAAFKKIDYIIYWGAYPNATADMASLIFPQVLPAENSGSFINIERRLQFMDRSYPTERAITTLIKLFTDFKIELGGQPYYSAAEVFGHLTKTIPVLSGLEYGKSEGSLLPLADSAVFIDEKDVPFAGPSVEFPFILTFAQSVYYGASGMTTRSQVLQKLMPEQSLWVTPDDARKLGIIDGEKVTLATPEESGQIKVAINPDIETGHIVLFGFSLENPANKFMNGHNKSVYAKIMKL